MSRLLLEVYSHSIKCTRFDYRCREALLTFSKRKQIAEWENQKLENGQWGYRPSKFYRGKTNDDKEFRFHRSVGRDLLQFLDVNGIRREQIDIVRYDPPEFETVDLQMHSHWKLKDDQIEPVAFVCSDEHERSKTMEIQCGRGKTLMANYTVSSLKRRTAYVVKAEHCEKWCSDLKEAFILDDSDWLVVRGRDDLVALVELAQAGLITAKIILFTVNTLRNYIKDYEECNGESMTYGCKPEELFELLRIGLCVRDEVHMDFHFHYRLELYMNVARYISMSATLTPSNKALRVFYEQLLPLDSRFVLEYNKYIKVKALFYSLNNRDYINRCLSYRRNYSHVEYEKIILRNPKMLDNYLRMVCEITELNYIQYRKEGLRFLIVAATKNMVAHIVSRLKSLHPELLIYRFIQGDKLSEAKKSDIIVSTIKKSGTALDIKGLMATFMTDAIDSQQTNEQVLGRTRELTEFDMNPSFIYLVCVDIAKHTKYHNSKIEFFNGKVLSHREYSTAYRV